MNAAKALVWVMSGLLLALLAVLVVGLSLGWHLDDPVSEASATGAMTTFDLVNLDQPGGTVITGVTDVDGKIAVSLSGGGEAPRIILVDSETGAVAGKIEIGKEGK